MTQALSKFQSFRLFAGKVGALAAPYFNSEEKWRARGLLAAIVALNLAAVYMLVLLNEWNRVFYDALQNKDAPVFWRELGRFTYLAFGFIVIAVYRFYLTQLLEMRWRAWMTVHYVNRWLANQAFYHLELARFTGNGNGLDNVINGGGGADTWNMKYNDLTWYGLKKGKILDFDPNSGDVLNLKDVFANGGSAVFYQSAMDGDAHVNLYREGHDAHLPLDFAFVQLSIHNPNGGMYNWEQLKASGAVIV